MNQTNQFADLYGKDKNGKTKIWKARVYEKKNESIVAIAEIQHGQLNGALQTSTREYTVGKNIGKKNETTPFEQAVAETKRKWQDKQEKEGYTVSADSNDANPVRKIYPMLAHKYEPYAKNKKNGIVFPCYVQPKLDGLRCIASFQQGIIWMQSRTGSFFEHLGHLHGELAEIFAKYPGIVLDGELYTTEMPFEELAGIIKKKKLDEKTGDVQRLRMVKYHLYDCILPLEPHSFESRWRELRRLVPQNNNDFHHIAFVETEWCNTTEEFRQYFAAYIQQGFEGIMLRNQRGLYRENYRSHDLQKYKEFVEDEYEIEGFTEGDGRDKGAVIWICKNKNWQNGMDEFKLFKVRPKGTMEYRRELFQNGDKYVGKMLTVIYQELSEYGVPRFPVGKAVREDY